MLRLIREACEKTRGYADFFGWPDRDIEELGVARTFLDVASKERGYPFTALASRGRGKDPPDCHARDVSGRHVAIELTELVDSAAIKKSRKTRTLQPAFWDQQKLTTRVEQILRKKDKGQQLLGGPYDEYVVLIYTDEPLLTLDDLHRWLDQHYFPAPSFIHRAYLIVAYDRRPPSQRFLRLQW